MDFNYYVNYFAILEKRLVETEKYVAFEKENLNTFSIEYASIINDCCGLINGFCFELCQLDNPNRTRFEMKDYKKWIEDVRGKAQLVYFDKFTLQPWEKLISNPINDKLSNPLWWNEYNSLKHSGKPNFMKATLKNAISCMAGMFALLVMYDFKRFGVIMCNWKGIFREAGNYRKNVDWEC
ncbi:MAG: hypothetical protein II980_04830 [Clostridia bacterium]|nr:hypothetical protein [Clostridia bacterium]